MIHHSKKNVWLGNKIYLLSTALFTASYSYRSLENDVDPLLCKFNPCTTLRISNFLKMTLSLLSKIMVWCSLSADSINLSCLLQAFSIFCGMGINNTHMYEKVCRSVAKQRVALEVITHTTLIFTQIKKNPEIVLNWHSLGRISKLVTRSSW